MGKRKKAEEGGAATAAAASDGDTDDGAQPAKQQKSAAPAPEASTVTATTTAVVNGTAQAKPKLPRPGAWCSEPLACSASHAANRREGPCSTHDSPPALLLQRGRTPAHAVAARTPRCAPPARCWGRYLETRCLARTTLMLAKPLAQRKSQSVGRYTLLWCLLRASPLQFCYYNNYNIKQPRFYCRVRAGLPGRLCKAQLLAPCLTERCCCVGLGTPTPCLSIRHPASHSPIPADLPAVLDGGRHAARHCARLWPPQEQGGGGSCQGRQGQGGRGGVPGPARSRQQRRGGRHGAAAGRRASWHDATTWRPERPATTGRSAWPATTGRPGAAVRDGLSAGPAGALHHAGGERAVGRLDWNHRAVQEAARC